MQHINLGLVSKLVKELDCKSRAYMAHGGSSPSQPTKKLISPGSSVGRVRRRSENVESLQRLSEEQKVTGSIPVWGADGK